MRFTLLFLLILVLVGVNPGCRSTPPGHVKDAPGALGSGSPDKLDTGQQAPIVPTGLTLKRPPKATDWLSGTHIVAIVNSEPVFASEVLQRQRGGLVRAKSEMTPPRYRALQEDLIRKQLDGYVERKLMSKALTDSLEPDQRKALREQLDVLFIENELPRLYADYEVDSRAELKKKLADEGLTLTVLKEDFQQQQSAMEFLRQKARVQEKFTPSEMLAWYRAHLDQFTIVPRVRWRQVLVTHGKHGDRSAARKVIDDAVRKLETGVKFADVAREFSDGPAASDGGQWDWTQKGSFSEDRVEKELFTLEIGTNSQVFEGDGYFQIVQPIAREDGGHVGFEEVQADIKKKMAEQERTREMKRVVDELKQTAVISTIFTESKKSDPSKPDQENPDRQNPVP